MVAVVGHCFLTQPWLIPQVGEAAWHETRKRLVKMLQNRDIGVDLLGAWQSG